MRFISVPRTWLRYYWILAVMYYRANHRPAVHSLDSHFPKRAWPPPMTIYEPRQTNQSENWDKRAGKCTLPVLVFLTSKATSLSPLGPVPTFHALVSSPSPGATGAVNLTLRYRSDEGLPCPTMRTNTRAAKPSVARPCKMTLWAGPGSFDHQLYLRGGRG
jgi:hypothetical protein